MKLPNSTFYILKFILLSFLCIILTKIHLFSNPIPSKIYYLIFFLETLIISLSYSFSSRLGRILLISGILLFSRIPSFLYPNLEINIIGGFLTGGVLGITINKIIYYLKLKTIRLNPEKIRRNTESIYLYFPILFFLLILIINNFTKYFHLPYLTNTDIQDYYYFTNVSSRVLFSIGSNTLINISYVLIYFIAENWYSESSEIDRSTDFKIGIVLVFLIQTIVIFIQTYYSIELFTSGVRDNFFIDNRVTGLFKDAGSATWIYPIILIYALNYLYLYKNISKFFNFIFYSIILFTIGSVLGYKQGRAYYIILFISFIVINYNFIKNLFFKMNIVKRIYTFLLAISFFLTLFVILSKYSNNGKLWTTVSQIYSSNDFFNKLISIDPIRYHLNMVGYYIFKNNLFFGDSISSVTTSLLNPNFIIPNPSRIVDGSGSFFLGIASDIGILGILILVLWIIQFTYLKKHSFILLIFIVPFLIGYQINNPDSCFFILLIFCGLYENKNTLHSIYIFISYIILFLSIIFLYKSYIYISMEEKVPLFRYNETGFYQISYYNKSKESTLTLNKEEENKKIVYHSFRGRLIWKLGDKRLFYSCTFIGEESSLSTLYLRYNYLDKDFKYLNHDNIMTFRYLVPQKLNITEKSEYIMIQEINPNSKLENKGNIYNVISTCFSNKNEFIGYSFDK